MTVKCTFILMLPEINSARQGLTHWRRVTHICVSKITIIGSDNGLSPDRRQAIIWINAGILLIGPCGTKFHEILIESQTFSFKKMHFKMSSGKWRPFCLGLNVLILILAISNMMFLSGGELIMAEVWRLLKEVSRKALGFDPFLRC